MKKRRPPYMSQDYPFRTTTWPPKVPYKKEPVSPIYVPSSEEDKGNGNEEEPIVLDVDEPRGDGPDGPPPPPPSTGAAGIACS